MRRFAIVAYPVLADADRAWIEAIRAQHDPQARTIAAHFTLVFPAEIAPEAIVAAAARARGTRAVSFVLQRAEPARDMSPGGGHVFLVPDEGRAAIVELHDRLYGGAMRPWLRQDIPFVPHMTVAAHADIRRCEALARELTAASRMVHGRLPFLDIVEVHAGSVRPVERVGLAES